MKIIAADTVFPVLIKKNSANNCYLLDISGVFWRIFVIPIK